MRETKLKRCGGGFVAPIELNEIEITELKEQQQV
jgi:hypothetical protein